MLSIIWGEVIPTKSKPNFLDLSFTFSDGTDLSPIVKNYLVKYHDGSWKINLLDLGLIRFKQKTYVMIFYDNKYKELKCWLDDEIYDKYKYDYLTSKKISEKMNHEIINDILLKEDQKTFLR